MWLVTGVLVVFAGGAVIGGLALLADRWLMRRIDGSEGG